MAVHSAGAEGGGLLLLGEVSPLGLLSPMCVKQLYNSRFFSVAKNGLDFPPSLGVKLQPLLLCPRCCCCSVFTAAKTGASAEKTKGVEGAGHRRVMHHPSSTVVCPLKAASGPVSCSTPYHYSTLAANGGDHPSSTQPQWSHR